MSSLVRAQADAGLLNAARATASSLPDTNELLQFIAEAQAKAGLFDEARATADDIIDSDCRCDAFTAIVEAQADAGLLEAACITMNEIDLDDSEKTKDQSNRINTLSFVAQTIITLK